MTMVPFTEAIRLAVFAFNKELLDLEKWLSDNLITYRDTFFEVILIKNSLRGGFKTTARLHI